ncbi:MAG: hypothetical protein WBE34_10380 [Candidatus Nitrosopolaris sp.]
MLPNTGIKAHKKSVKRSDTIIAYRSKFKDVEIRYDVSFGLIYDIRGLVLFTGLDREAGKKA